MSMFIKTISQLNRRGSVIELDEAVSNAVQSVRRTGKPAKITYEITLKPQDAEGEQVQVSDKIKVTTADMPRKAATFFTSEDGTISREDPNQAELNLRSVKGGKPEEQQTETQREAVAS